MDWLIRYSWSWSLKFGPLLSSSGLPPDEPPPERWPPDEPPDRLLPGLSMLFRGSFLPCGVFITDALRPLPSETVLLLKKPKKLRSLLSFLSLLILSFILLLYYWMLHIEIYLICSSLAASSCFCFSRNSISSFLFRSSTAAWILTWPKTWSLSV